MPYIRLQSNDGEIVPVDVEIAKMSGTLKNMLDDLGIEEAGEEAVPLPNVTAAVLKKVAKWATHHKDDPPLPENYEKREMIADDISEWDKEFFKVEQGELFDLILAANYLDINGLLETACKTVANMINGKTPGEMRKTFNIENDFDPKLYEEMKRERYSSNNLGSYRW